MHVFNILVGETYAKMNVEDEYKYNHNILKFFKFKFLLLFMN